MGYRGEEIELRTLQGWSGSGREQDAGTSGSAGWWMRPAAHSGNRNEPIVVDDVVLAVSAHAFDLAAAHRAVEVRLEHLLHALTLDETSAAVLDHRGIRASGLRRDTAAAIAELTPGHVNGKGSPRKSEDVDEVFRQAAERAYPRGTPVNVDDLLHVMFDSKRDMPGLGLLYRNGSGWSPREERQEMRLEPLPHLSPRPVQGELRLSNDEIRARAQNYLGEGRELRPSQAVAPVGSSSLDAQQNFRLEGLERAFKELSTDITDERKSFQSFLTELKRNVTVQTDDTLRFRGGVSERLKGLEDLLQNSRSDGTLAPGGLGERLSGIELALEAMQRALTTMLDRISSVEVKLAGRGPIDLTPVEERINSFERTLLARVPQGSDLSSVTELLSGIETRTDETAHGTAEITERLVKLERALENRAAETGRTVSFVGERMRAFEEQTTRLEQLVGEQLQEIGKVAAQGSDQIGRVNTALETVTANQRMLAQAFDQWRLDAGGDLGVIDNRVQVLEVTAKTLQPQFEQLAGQMAVVHAVMAKREANKSHWRNWLFGTDDWYSASWNTKRWRVAQSQLDEADARLERVRVRPVGNVPAKR